VLRAGAGKPLFLSTVPTGTQVAIGDPDLKAKLNSNRKNSWIGFKRVVDDGTLRGLFSDQISDKEEEIEFFEMTNVISSCNIAAVELQSIVPTNGTVL
jgi:hypothetical protein